MITTHACHHGCAVVLWLSGLPWMAIGHVGEERLRAVFADDLAAS